MQQRRWAASPRASTQRRHAAVRLGRAPRTQQESSPRHAVTAYKEYSGELQCAALSATSAACFRAACAGGDGMGMGALGKFLCCQRGKRENCLVVVCMCAWGTTPRGDRQLFLPLQLRLLLGWGWKEATQELEEWWPLCSPLNMTAPPLFVHLCLMPGYLTICQHQTLYNRTP